MCVVYLYRLQSIENDHRGGLKEPGRLERKNASQSEFASVTSYRSLYQL